MEIFDQDPVCAEILSMLLAAGYFRARLPGLDTFDKILGGMSWCLSQANEDVSIDFSDSMNIGSKVKAAESFCKSLQAARCPHQLLAHQISGKDYEKILPVVQWLIQYMIEQQEKRAKKFRFQSNHYYEKSSQFIGKKKLEKKQQEKITDNLTSLKQKNNPKRKFKPKEQKALDDPERAFTALAEFGDTSAMQRYNKLFKTSPQDLEEKPKPKKGQFELKTQLDKMKKRIEQAKQEELGFKYGSGMNTFEKYFVTEQPQQQTVEIQEQALPKVQLDEDEVQVYSLNLKEEVDNIVEYEDEETQSVAEEEKFHIEFERRMSRAGSIVMNQIGVQIQEFVESQTFQAEVQTYQEEIEEKVDEVQDEMLKFEKEKLQKQIEQLKKRIEMLQLQISNQKEQQEKLTVEYKQVQIQINEITPQKDKYQILVETIREQIIQNPLWQGNEPLRSELLQLVEQLFNTKDTIRDYKGSCKQELAQLGFEKQRLTSFTTSINQELKLIWEKEQAKLMEKKSELAQFNQEVAVLRRKLESLPTSTELQQYQRRFMELYEQINAKLEETRKCYNTFNTLEEVKQLMQHRIQVLNQFLVGFSNLQKKGKKETFQQNLQSTVDSLKQNVTKAHNKLMQLDEQAKTLEEKLIKLNDEEREFYRTLKQFQNIMNQLVDA